MRFLPSTVIALGALLLVAAKKPSRPRQVQSSSTRSGGNSSRRPAVGGGRPATGRAPVSRRRPVYEEEESEEDAYDADDLFEADTSLGMHFDDENEEEDDEPVIKRGRRNPAFVNRNQGSSSAARDRSSSSRRTGSKSRPPPRRSSRFPDTEDDYEDEYAPPARRRGPPTRASSSRQRGPPPRRGGRPGGRVVPYKQPGPGAAERFTKGWAAVKSVMPDPGTVKDAALSGISAARHTTSNLSSNIFREVKGLTSSELEQVMLKATRPDDTAVKGKHVERLVGVTYQISSRYDIYDAVLRKLWSKMAEKDWRTTVKALYILHRFSADGAPEHAPALKARLRELRRTRDPKRKGDKYFNSKQLLAGDADPESIKFRAFMSRYAHYVLLRAQCFGGLFDEISTLPKPDKKSSKATPKKPITSTCLRPEHLNAAGMLLKAGLVCQLKEGEECENTAIASERVASDMIGLTTAVAIALNRALKDDKMAADPALLKKWCVFYSQELLPQTKAMVKKTSPKLDAYGLFLPSRMGTSVAPHLLEKGLHLDDDVDKTTDVTTTATAEGITSGAAAEASGTDNTAQELDGAKQKAAASVVDEADEVDEVDVDEEDDEEEEDAVEEEAEFDEEYEYEEEEYYDEE